MDMEAWGKSHVILVAPEDLEGKEEYKLLTYAQNNPKKFFLLPASADFLKVMDDLLENLSQEEDEQMGIFPPFAQNLKFSLPVTVHFENVEVVVEDLASLLNEWLPKREMGVYIIAPDCDTVLAIRRQLALLGLQMAIYDPSEVEVVHWEKKLQTAKDKLEQEIPYSQDFCRNITEELLGSFARNLVQKFSEALEELVGYLNSTGRKVSLQICGEEKSDLAFFLGKFFTVSEYDANRNADLYLVVLATQLGNYNKELLEELIKKHPQNLLFLVYQSANESVKANIPRSQFLAVWEKELSQIGVTDGIILFAEGADFLVENQEEWIFSNLTIDSLLASKKCSGKEEYQMRSFLEKIFYQNTSLTGEEFLSRLGLLQLLKFCQEVRKTNVNFGELAKRMSLATAFLVDAKWQRLYAAHETEADQKELRFIRDRLKLELALQKFDAAVGEKALKAALYEIGLLIDKTISMIQVQGKDALKNLQQEELLNEEIMDSIHNRHESNLEVALKDLAKEIEEEAASDVVSLKNSLSIILQRVRDDASSAIESLRAVAESFEQKPNIQSAFPTCEPQLMSILSIPTIIEEEALLKIVLNNTEVFCSDVGDRSNPGQGAAFEYCYLWGSFGVELQEALKTSLTKKINSWRLKIYKENTAYVKNFFHELKDFPQREIQYSKSVLDNLQVSISKEREADAHDYSVLDNRRSQLQSFIRIWQEIESQESR